MGGEKFVVRDIKKQYLDIDYYDAENLIQSMSDVYEETGNQFVIIIDEWDAVFRACKEDKDGQKLYLEVAESTNWQRNTSIAT